MSQVEINKANARRTWEEIFPAGDVDALDEVMAPDVMDHGRRPDEPGGIEGAKRTVRWLASVFSDQRWEIHEVIGEGDMVAVFCTHRGRHTGELWGIPPTNREFAYEYVHILRFRDGKATDHWGIRDDMTLMRQLGVLPERPLAASAPRGSVPVG